MEHAPADKPGQGGGLALGLVVLVAAFALIPRLFGGGTRSGADAPPFTAELVANAPEGSGKEVSLESLRGRPVVLDFWATWCGPCRAEAPVVDGLASRFKDKGLVTLGVNTSDEEGLAAGWAARNRISFPIVYDRDNAIAGAYDVHNIPTLVVIDRQGKIHAVRTGVTPASELERLVREVL